MIKNSEPFEKKCQKTAGGIFDSLRRGLQVCNHAVVFFGPAFSAFVEFAIRNTKFGDEF